MTPRPILIVGLQKSGTSLLARLLQDCGVATNPFQGEGDDVFGNQPPFAPEGEPAGRVYQAACGARGHECEAADLTPADRALVARRIAALEADPTRPWLNKNPYHVVRLPWLRALFPEAVIVATLRAPVANVFSLAKKYRPHPGRGLEPVEGWWGVKPAGWRELRDADVIAQSARQWRAVNSRLHRHLEFVDLLLRYDALCADPRAAVVRVATLATGREPTGLPRLPEIRCFDEEHRRGSRLRSKNRYWRERGTLETPATEDAEMPPFTSAEVERVERETREVLARFAG